LIVLDGDLSCHATHGMYATLVACLDEKLNVGIHERYGHGHRVTVWKNEVGVLAEALDSVENVVPTSAVEACRVVAELIDNLCR
jgi:hypothetical protein